MLTKSAYLRGYDCVRRLWLDHYRKDLRAELADSVLDRMEAGKSIGELARKNHPAGIEVPRSTSLEEAAAATRSLMDDGCECLFEATFVAGDRAVRVDILTNGIGGWTIDEVKSSTLKHPSKIDANKILDLAYQLDTVRKAGLPVRRARLVLIDSNYVWQPGDALERDMLVPLDLTEECEKVLQKIPLSAGELISALSNEIEPEVELNTHCKPCDYFSYCHREGRGTDLIFLPGIRSSEVRKLRSLDIHSIRSIPEDYKLTERQRLVRETLSGGQPHIGQGLAEALSNLRFPAAFIDFETVSSPIPLYPRTRPYQQICFQWSAHVTYGAGSLPMHYEYLASGADDPRPEFCRSLWNLVKDSGSLVHYTGFELAQIRSMAEAGIPFAAHLLVAFEERMFDLERVVREHVYLEAFMGRSSIKVVLPALVPEMSYRHLKISDGFMASIAFRRLLTEKLSPQDVNDLRTALLDYCHQDTLAMVEIYGALSNLAKSVALGSSATTLGSGFTGAP